MSEALAFVAADVGRTVGSRSDVLASYEVLAPFWSFGGCMLLGRDRLSLTDCRWMCMRGSGCIEMALEMSMVSG